jgi:DNA-binding NtrC family response regulator
LGYVVTVCSSGEQALKTLGVTTFDVLLTDFELGGKIDGLALLDLVQKSAPQTALILMSGKLSAKEIVLVGPKFIAKPINQTSLTRALTH